MTEQEKVTSQCSDCLIEVTIPMGRFYYILLS